MDMQLFLEATGNWMVSSFRALPELFRSDSWLQHWNISLLLFFSGRFIGAGLLYQHTSWSSERVLFASTLAATAFATGIAAQAGDSGSLLVILLYLIFATVQWTRAACDEADRLGLPVPRLDQIATAAWRKIAARLSQTLTRKEL